MFTDTPAPAIGKLKVDFCFVCKKQNSGQYVYCKECIDAAKKEAKKQNPALTSNNYTLENAAFEILKKKAEEKTLPEVKPEEKTSVLKTEANKTKIQLNSTMPEGKIQKACPGCGSALKLQHTINTATKKEWLTYNCSDCNYSYRTDKFPARDLPEGHSFNSLWARLVFNYLKKERAL